MLTMLLRTRLVKSIARLMLAALLLVQGIYVAQACVFNADRPTLAFAQADHCKMQDKHGSVSPNACLSQCLQADQSSAAHPADIPPAPGSVLLVLPLLSDGAMAKGFSKIDPINDTGPPPLRRFCSLLL